MIEENDLDQYGVQAFEENNSKIRKSRVTPKLLNAVIYNGGQPSFGAIEQPKQEKSEDSDFNEDDYLLPDLNQNNEE